MVDAPLRHRLSQQVGNPGFQPKGA